MWAQAKERLADHPLTFHRKHDPSSAANISLLRRHDEPGYRRQSFARFLNQLQREFRRFARSSSRATGETGSVLLFRFSVGHFIGWTFGGPVGRKAICY